MRTELQCLLVFLLKIIGLLAPVVGQTTFPSFSPTISRSSFPDGFVFGSSSSSYQSEGAAHMDGRAPSMWDTFCQEQPDKIADHSNGNVADDFYHLYKKDIALMKEIGMDSFRFSISWPRVLPTGKISGGVNWEGVHFYNSLIDKLILNGLRPLVTLFHWDVPQALMDDYDGFLSPKIVDDFRDYVDFCFNEFGDRVKHWIVINEMNIFSALGYAVGINAPGRCSSYIGNCTHGNSATEPYIVVHHLLLCQGAAVTLYRGKYQASQEGVIGFTVAVTWMTPKYETEASREAASRARDFNFGWIIHPLTYGDYPQSMRYWVGNRLPKFTQAQVEIVNGSYDFIGMNYYTTNYVDNVTYYNSVNLSYTTDSRANQTYEKNGTLIGAPTVADWLYICPKGIRDALVYLKKEYKNPTIYVTENGMPDNGSLSLPDALEDNLRIEYHHRHLSYLLQAVKEGVDVIGYYVWTFLDNFEWSYGYTERYGIVFVDYKNALKRRLKNSALWFKEFLRRDNADSSSSL